MSAMFHRVKLANHCHWKGRHESLLFSCIGGELIGCQDKTEEVEENWAGQHQAVHTWWNRSG